MTDYRKLGDELLEWVTLKSTANPTRIKGVREMIVPEKYQTNKTPYGLMTPQEQDYLIALRQAGATFHVWSTTGDFWLKIKSPRDFEHFEVLRVSAPEKVKPSIDWSAINKKWNWLAMDSDGTWYLYDKSPDLIINSGIWGSANSDYECRLLRSDLLRSFEPGNVEWTDSLIVRP